MSNHHLNKVKQTSPRAYIKRQGRISCRQQRGLSYGDRYGIDQTDDWVDVGALFPRQSEKILDIGFGMGEALLLMAAAQPEKDFLAVDLYRPGIGHVMAALDEQDIHNVRVYSGDAVVFIEQLQENSIDCVQIFFPDPWPKKRHAKRRLIQEDVVAQLSHIIKPGGILHIASDWQPYAHDIRDMLLSQEIVWRNLGDASGFCKRPAHRPMTKYEQRGVRLNHDVYDLMYARNS